MRPVNVSNKIKTASKAFGFIESFLHWLHTEGYKINPSVLEYKTNLPVVRKTVTFLKYNELMDFYHFKFSDEEKNLELVSDQFCFYGVYISDIQQFSKS